MMSDPLNARLNKILPKVISDEFLSGSGIGNEIAFYIFDYPPEDELRVRDYVRTLLDHIPKQKHGLRVKHVNLFDRRQWPCSRAAEQRDELAPLHSITSSTRMSIDMGTSSPSAFAVLRLMTRSSFTAC
jgi:hypothetical protein